MFVYGAVSLDAGVERKESRSWPCGCWLELTVWRWSKPRKTYATEQCEVHCHDMINSPVRRKRQPV